MKKRTLVIAMSAAVVMSVACSKNENSEPTQTQLAVQQQDTGREKLDIMWCHLDECSDVKEKGAVMDMLWHLFGSRVLLISEPGNPDVGVVLCDDPGAAQLMAKIRQVAKGAKSESIITKDKAERDAWQERMEKEGMHVILWRDDEGFYYGLALTEDEWCKYTGLGCSD